ncbi:PREDICTED: CWF19-like protein 2 [Gekko japonicus]|uniref:CWF19-like protein 2 n=1 Tax=Gekko japonicus TaxID=146911 RepID=A0ABM1KRN8_GEKJA|nr:PREDICTED: CWF19-like protein 2 [Gekko japonicus]
MASGFESERSLAARKEERRRQREALLQQAKADYEKEQRRKELKRLQGEDTWMLSDVTARVEELEKEHSVTKKKKKEKHSKKSRKEKKKKKDKTEKNDDSSDSPSDFSEEWVEAPVSDSSSTGKAWKVKKEQPDTIESPAAVQRDEWMTLNFMTIKTLSSASLKAEKQKAKILEQQKAQASEQSLLSERELNPYWKDGGTGLPSEEDNSIKAAVVEDGGLGWLKKSYQRMREQSERENRDLEEIIAERYGSVDMFESRLKEAERAAVQKENEHRRWQKYEYSEDVRQRKDKEKHEERDGYQGKPKDRNSKDYFQEMRNYMRERLTEDKHPRHSSIGSAGKDFSSRTAQYSHQRSCEKSSPGPLKPAFWKPHEDGGQEVQSFSSSKLRTQGSATCGFRKPNYDTEDIPVRHGFRKPDYSTEEIPRWRRTQPKEVDGKATLDEKPSTTEMAALDEKPSTTGMAVTSRKNDPREKKEIGEDALESEEPSHSKSSYFGSAVEDESPHILSEEEMNKLGAKIVKAELTGNTDLAAKLQTQLDKARKLKESRAQIPARKPEEETTGLQEDYDVVLVRTDKSGRSWPVSAPGEPMEPKGGRRKRQTITTHMDKERVRYFQDDDNLSLKDLVRNEKMRTAEDQNKLFMRMASKFSDKTDREYYTLDDMFVSNAAKGERSGEEEERQRKQAVQEHRRLAACMEKCPHCFGSPELPKHLIIAIGNKVYLSLPNYQSLTEGHCLIAPMQHYTAATLLDEDIWEEIQAFRKTLVKMFEAEDQDCVFLETHLSTKKRYHMVYECIPLPREVGDMAPIYFKKAIMECDEEWSMNKKLIDLSSKDVRKCVPKGLPYFSVDFGLQAGFAHVIEDQHKFPLYFGKEIIGGMLDLEPRLWRKGLRENFEDQRKKVLHFAQRWKPYDFTRSKD